ncbi:MAG: hypothetical protein HGN29_13365 [Asgard group archaeon]|nr:hypothetical protein [Asgard group archaeon]
MKKEDREDLINKIDSFINRLKNMKRYQYGRWEEFDELKDEIEIFQRRQIPKIMLFDLSYPSEEKKDEDFEELDEEEVLDLFLDDVEYYLAKLTKQKKEIKEYGLPISIIKEKTPQKIEKKKEETQPKREEITEKNGTVRYFLTNIACSREERDFFIRGVIMGILYIGIPLFATMISLIIALIVK